MAATNAQVRAAIFAALEMPGVHRYEFPQDNVEVPAVMVGGLEYTPLTFGTGRRVTATVIVAVSRGHVDQFRLLDELLDETGDLSLVEMINAGSTTDVELTVTGVGDYGDVVLGDITYVGAPVTVEALT